MLDAKEQKHVRTALRHLRTRLGSWAVVADALHYSPKTLDGVINEWDAVSVPMAFKLARFLGVSIDGLLAGQAVPVGTCAHCGHAPDFDDEDTSPGAPAPLAPSPLRVVK